MVTGRGWALASIGATRKREQAAGARGKRRLRLRLRSDRETVVAGERAVLELRPRRGPQKRRLRRWVNRKGAQAEARITVTFRDAATNKSTKKLTVELR